IALGVADLPADGELVVLVRRPEPFEPRDVGLEPRLLHQAWIARSDGFGHGELVGLSLTEVLEPAHRRVAGERRGDEAGLALVVLPHLRVHRAFGGIGEYVDHIVRVALPKN